ncbi:hypothetical protein M885DRAFT_133821 [Pelagophyceae sp. CCMP2097]|nr:hypothetical protein M885DRAFT_133821 [Pelagophyceae sp. CCMP2097]
MTCLGSSRRTSSTGSLGRRRDASRVPFRAGFVGDAPRLCLGETRLRTSPMSVRVYLTQQERTATGCRCLCGRRKSTFVKGGRRGAGTSAGGVYLTQQGRTVTRCRCLSGRRKSTFVKGGRREAGASAGTRESTSAWGGHRGCCTFEVIDTGGLVPPRRRESTFVDGGRRWGWCLCARTKVHLYLGWASLLAPGHRYLVWLAWTLTRRRALDRPLLGAGNTGAVSPR